jgi:hypothetical protein
MLSILFGKHVLGDFFANSSGRTVPGKIFLFLQSHKEVFVITDLGFAG